MIKVYRKDDETVEHLIKRFERARRREGVGDAYKSHLHYDSPSEQRRQKHHKAVIREKRRRRRRRNNGNL